MGNLEEEKFQHYRFSVGRTCEVLSTKLMNFCDNFFISFFLTSPTPKLSIDPEISKNPK